MAKSNRTKTITLVIRMWLESDKTGLDTWRGTIVQPTTEVQQHFCGPEELLEEIQRVVNSDPQSTKVD